MCASILFILLQHKDKSTTADRNVLCKVRHTISSHALNIRRRDSAVAWLGPSSSPGRSKICPSSRLPDCSRASQASYSTGTEDFRGVKLTTHLHLVPKTGVRGSSHPLSHTPSWRAAYLVKHREKFTSHVWIQEGGNVRVISADGPEVIRLLMNKKLRMKASQHITEPEGSIPNSQELSTCPYNEPDQSSPNHPIPPLQDPSQCYPSNYVLVFLAASFPLAFPQTYARSSSRPFVLHAPPHTAESKMYI
jgi:hypothetical protein